MDRIPRIDMLLSLLEKEPEDIFLNYALAVEFVGEKKLEEAEKQFLKTIKLNSEYLPSYYQLAQVSEKLMKEKEALEYYKLGLALAQKQNNQKAVNELNEAIWMLDDN